jgi:hypothetical protein
MLRLAAAVAVAATIALFVGAMYPRFSDDADHSPWASWVHRDNWSENWLGCDSTTYPYPTPEEVACEFMIPLSAQQPASICRRVIKPGWHGSSGPPPPIESVLSGIYAANSCNRPDPSTAKVTQTTGHAAREVVQARGGLYPLYCEPPCSSPVWLVEVRGTFVPSEPYQAGIIISNSIHVRQSPSGTPVAGTWYAIVPVPTTFTTAR